MWSIGGHLGSAVSALVDGQLDPETEERAWSHVLSCESCRRLVQREGWVKNRLATMTGDQPSERLLGSLYELDDSVERVRPSWDDLQAWAAVDEIERKGRGRRRAGLALVGAGSVSAAVFGIATFGAASLGIGGAPAGTPATSLTGPSSTATPTTAVIAPAVVVHGRVPGYLQPAGDKRGVDLQRRR